MLVGKRIAALAFAQTLNCDEPVNENAWGILSLAITLFRNEIALS